MGGEYAGKEAKFNTGWRFVANTVEWKYTVDFRLGKVGPFSIVHLMALFARPYPRGRYNWVSRYRRP